MIKNQRRFWCFATLSLLWLGFIIFQSVQTSDDSNEISGGVLELLMRVFPFLTMHIVRKLAHFTEFSLLGIFSCGAVLQLKKPQPAISALFGLMCALLDETIQLYIPGRSGQVSDVWLDFSGVVAGLVFVCALSYYMQKKR